ncbi:MAG: hypothetical protein EXR75_14965, partial [Myxococcales bacterium]|nr:hypothetical protein [Myxococcales bacterium]
MSAVTLPTSVSAAGSLNTGFFVKPSTVRPLKLARASALVQDDVEANRRLPKARSLQSIAVSTSAAPSATLREDATKHDRAAETRRSLQGAARNTDGGVAIVKLVDASLSAIEGSLNSLRGLAELGAS